MSISIFPIKLICERKCLKNATNIFQAGKIGDSYPTNNGWRTFYMSASKIASSTLASPVIPAEQHIPPFLANSRELLNRFISFPCEIRMIPNEKRMSVVSKKIDSIDSLHNFFDTPKTNKYNYYFSFNKVARTSDCVNIKDTDISNRRWLFIDIDPEHKIGENATKTQTVEVYNIASDVIRYLEKFNFSKYIIACSGNGYHIFYRIDLENTDENNIIYTNFIKALKSKFPRIDSSVSNTGRIVRLYSLPNYKCPDRPLDTGFIKFPDDAENTIHSPELMQQVIAAIAEEQKKVQPTKEGKSLKRERTKAEQGYGSPATMELLENFLNAAGVSYKQGTIPGQNISCFFVDCPNASAHTTPTRERDAACWIYDGKFCYKCFHESCGIKGWNDFRNEVDPKNNIIFSKNKYSQDKRTIIQYTASSLGVQNSIKELAAELSKSNFYLYCNNLANIKKLTEQRRPYKNGPALPAGASVIELATQENIFANALNIRWQSVDSRQQGKFIEIIPPKNVVANFLGSYNIWRETFRELTGIINAPHMRHDGTIISEEGYDEQTGLFADFGGQTFRAISDNPTEKEIAEATNWVNQLLEEFPFKRTNSDADDGSRGVAISAFLTAVSRNAYQNAPLFAFDAPAAGTGKSTLADLVSIVATGSVAPATNYTKDPAELRKTIFSVLCEGVSIMLLDNIVDEVNSPTLNSALTQEIMKDRILGQTKTSSVWTKALWMATGNNLQIVGDMTRRVIICTLDASVERPADRQFKKDIVSWTLQNRTNLVWSFLTLLKAGYNTKWGRLTPMNSYNDWSNIVRKTVIALGLGTDPKNTQLEMEQNDSRRQAVFNILTAWEKCFHEHKTADEIIKDLDINGNNQNMVEFRELLNTFIPHKGDLNSRHLGKWCSINNGTMQNGLKLVKGLSYKNKIQWKVENINNNKNSAAKEKELEEALNDI